MDTLKKKAVCLFSGGLDSATTLYVARNNGYQPLALTVDYGQVHVRELESAKQIARHIEIEHEMIKISLPWGGSALLDPSIAIPENRNSEHMSDTIPVTYVPARNTVLLSLAASYAEARGAQAIFIGANAVDYSGYPDCRPEYLAQFESLLKLGTKQGIEGRTIEVKAPLVTLSKAEIIQLALGLRVPIEWTWSCYKGGAHPCGVCDSCILRAEGFRAAGVHDPLLKIGTDTSFGEVVKKVSVPNL